MIDGDSPAFRHFDKTVSGACHSILIERCSQNATIDSSAAEDAARFVLGQWSRMPDVMRAPFVVVTLAFSVSSVLRHGQRFDGLPHAARWAQLERWRSAKIGVCRDFVRFLESFVILHWHSRGFPVDRGHARSSPAVDERAAR